MKKELYFELTDNGDLNVTVHTLEVCAQIIEAELEGVQREDLENMRYTISPAWLTYDEYLALGEWEG